MDSFSIDDRGTRRAGIGAYSVVLAFLVALGVTVWWMLRLWLGLPTVQAIDGWFWQIHDQRMLGFGLLGASLFAFPYALRACARPSLHGRNRLLIGLVALGFCYQHGLALAENRGLEAIRDRMLRSGHAEFAVTASRRLNVYATMRDYESFVTSPDQQYARSKPPGQLLFYFAVAGLARDVMPLVWNPARPEHSSTINRAHFRLIELSVVLFPLLGVLTVVPLTLLARSLLPDELTLWPALLYLTAPAPSLVQMHLDQALYPLLAASFWLACAHAAAARSRWPWVWAGVLAWLALFVSFSLLPILPIGGALALARAHALLRHESWWKRAVQGALVSLLAFLLLSVVARIVIHYDPFVAYTRSMRNHLAWKGWDESRRWSSAELDLAEFGYWLGAPLAALFVAAALAVLRKPRSEPTRVLAAATFLAILLTAVYGKTIAEVARLWIFFIPAVVIAAVASLARLPRQARVLTRENVFSWLVVLQLLWTFSLKAMEDFY